MKLELKRHATLAMMPGCIDGKHVPTSPVTAPVDGTVLIMPSRRLDKGMTAVRLGRYLA